MKSASLQKFNDFNSWRHLEPYTRFCLKIGHRISGLLRHVKFCLRLNISLVPHAEARCGGADSPSKASAETKSINQSATPKVLAAQLPTHAHSLEGSQY
jgi:hypothetical protein